MRLNLEDDNVFMLDSISVEEARNIDQELPDSVTMVFDEAQGHVHMGNSKVAYVVIKIEG